MKVVAFVPIKLNSQRIPHKNTREIGGHPLCWHICNTLLSANGLDEVYVYCSTEKVSQYLPQNTRVLIRPQELDADETKGAQIYKEFISQVEADAYLLAHTTSPFISRKSIECGVSAVRSGDYDSAFSARRFQTFAWYNGSPINYDPSDIPRTQDMEPIWVETSGFYIFLKELFASRGRRIGYNPYVVEVDDIEAIDIDEPSDFAYAELLANCLLEKVENSD